MPSSDLRFTELFGLKPFGLTAAQAKLVFLGDRSLPKSRFGVSSLGVFTPRLSIETWRGNRICDRTIPLLNLYNRTPTPVEDGWSVRITQVYDFRGRKLTYDSHNGTDFVVPPGTKVTPSAKGRVVARRREWNRGGLKLYIDHGAGLLTTYNHLGRALVEVGDVVSPGQIIALSAYSGADGFLTFPWVAPHVHYNVLLGGVHIDPFAAPGEVSCWSADNTPRSITPEDASFVPTAFDNDRVDRMLQDLKDDTRRRLFSSISDHTLRGFELMIEANTYPTLFRTPSAGRMLYPDPPERQSRLALPFLASDFDDVAFCDDLGFRG